jgi:hypothetical protein
LQPRLIEDLQLSTLDFLVRLPAAGRSTNFATSANTQLQPRLIEDLQLSTLDFLVRLPAAGRSTNFATSANGVQRNQILKSKPIYRSEFTKACHY